MLFDWSHPNATANPPPPSLRFWVDAPSSIPVEIINLLVNVKALGLIRLVRMLRLIRLVKLLKVEEYLEALEDLLDVSLRSLRLIFLTVRMCFLGHIMACFWFGVRTFSVPEELLGTMQEATYVDGISSGPTWQATYASDAAASRNATTARRYLYASYYAMTTMSTTGCLRHCRPHFLTSPPTFLALVLLGMATSLHRTTWRSHSAASPSFLLPSCLASSSLRSALLWHRWTARPPYSRRS